MKTILMSLVLLASVSSFAAAATKAKTLTCTDHSNSDMQMQIVVGAEGGVESISLYNIDWSQSPEATKKEILAIGTYNPMAGIDVILKDGQTVAIDYSVLDGKDGQVTLNGTDSYYCN